MKNMVSQANPSILTTQSNQGLRYRRRLLGLRAGVQHLFLINRSSRFFPSSP